MNYKVVLIASISIFIIILIIVTLPWTLLFIGLKLQPNPEIPEIKYGEFPFRLTYSINGVTKVIEDTLICEYDGIGMNEGIGKYIKWKSHLASGKNNILLLNVDSPQGIALDETTIKQEIYFDPGPAWYYMNDTRLGSEYKHIYPDASFKEEYQDGRSAEGIIEKDELLEKYNIKLIGWEYTQPIINNFSTTKK
ncbi:hypothetical protein ACFOQM_16165 [Paenibacillus sp. GCM10012307]|uniref:Uncharacterized protein n=1 Tax=Paenibacillus roseus TaxID=2798579 RepID=A0A934J6S2_9BACL|nr:hypothetical protein [Paenibacillus roseus]MBJ6362779.1 hypothetical protein [Paenibacillus roseus]